MLFFQGCAPEPAPPSEPVEAFVRATNLGRAFLENKDSKSATESFRAAVDLEPRAMAWRNLARAQLLARDHGEVRISVRQALSLDPGSAAAYYLVGLADSRDTRFEEAVASLEESVRLAPDVAAARYQLASAYRSLGRHEEAESQLRATLEIDPLHATAYYQLSLYAQQEGNDAEARRLRRDFDRLRQLFGDEVRSLDALELCVHMKAETVAPREEAPEALEVRFAAFDPGVEGTGAWGDVGVWGDTGVLGDVVASEAVAVTAEGDVRVMTARRDGSLWIGGPGLAEPTRVADPPAGFESGGADGSTVQLVAGNFHDPWPFDTPFDPRIHSRPDVVEVRGGSLRLFRGTLENTFEDVTAESGLEGAGPGIRRAHWWDAEADGDLDLGLATESGLELWQNNGNGTFQEIAALVGLRLDEPALDLAAADLNGDLALDVVVAGPEGTRVFENRRTGLYEPRTSPPDPWPAATALAVDDLDQDARDDVVLLTTEGTVSVWLAAGGREDLDPEGAALRDVAVVDYDNDGRLDLIAAGADASAEEGGAIRLWRNAGGAPGEAWQPVTEATALASLDLPSIVGLSTLDVDLDGDVDLVPSTAEGSLVVRNDGGDGHGRLRLRLVGTKTNPDGLGTRVEVRRGRFQAVHRVDRLPVEVGIGPGSGPLDSVRLLWTNGIVDHQTRVEPTDDVLHLVEKNVSAGSCPFLYAWDGQEFRFVTDLLGNSPVGLSISRGVPLDADPDEYVWIGGADRLAPRDGRYVLQVTEEMREVLYLDTAHLVAVDHPPSVEIHPTDKLMPAPFPDSELWALQEPRPARSVHSSDGVDRLEALSALDGVFAPPGPLLPPPLRGATRPMSLELDFGAVDPSRAWVLALTGWLQYGDASTNIALSQGAAEVVPPRLEVLSRQGYRPLDVVVGLPAGKTKTILVDLQGLLPADLPEGRLRLRLTHTFEVSWDRIALGERVLPPEMTVHELPTMSAELAERGFSDIRARVPGGPTTPKFDDLLERPPWTTALEGWATRYGDVEELVRERDARLVLVSAGDGLELTFDAEALPDPAPGSTRTFFFYSVGWDKDGDMNVIDGDRIAPLPVTAEDESWRLEYNTRWVPRDLFSR